MMGVAYVSAPIALAEVIAFPADLLLRMLGAGFWIGIECDIIRKRISDD
jgi:hypothetical protein